MNKTRLLTSMAVFGVFTMPAMADIASNAESATCDSGTIGVSSGSTVLEALWTAQSKNCDAGTYLNSTTANCTPCPAGSFCAGGDYTYNGSNVGLTGTCPTNYSSDEGASAQTDCYRACETTDIAHSTAVSGRYYYGDNNQCTPTQCAAGYTPKAGLDLANANLTFTNSAFGSINAPHENNGYSPSYSAMYAQIAHSQEYYGLTEHNTWARESAEGVIIYGQGRCSTTQGYKDTVNNNNNNWNNPTTLSSLTDETGETGAQYCYCNVTGFKASGSDSFVSLSSSWVFRNNYKSASACADDCAYACVGQMGDDYYDTGFYSALFGSVAPTAASCSINTYTCSAGTYLDNATETCVTCQAGSYCAGGYFTYNGNDQGRETCSGEYNLSDAGSSSINDCYRTCETTDVLHATAVSGRYYYGDNNQCEPTTCAAGWHVKEGFYLKSDYESATQVNSMTNTSASINNSGVFKENYNSDYSEAKGQAFYEITESNTWASYLSDYGFGMVRGKSVCSSTAGDYYVATSTDPDMTGTGDTKYCYCQITGYKPQNGVMHDINYQQWVLVHHGGSGDAESCNDYCADSCITTSALYDIPAASCEANTINIDWYNLGSLLQSNSCTYGQSDIVIPEVPERTGYDFGGWKVKTND